MPYVGANRFIEADNGLFVLGNTAAVNYGGESIIDRVAEINEHLSTSTVWSGPLGFGGETTTSKDVFDRTLMGVFDRGTLERYGLPIEDAGGRMYGDLGNSRKLALRDLLRDEGVMPEGGRLSDIKNFIALPAEQVGSEGRGGSSLKTAFHEIGHSASYTIGHNAGFSGEIERFNKISDPSEVDYLEHYLRRMAYHGAEEGRAESLGILGTGASKEGDKFRERISRGKNIAYTNPDSFNTMYGETLLSTSGYPLRQTPGILLTGELTAKQSFRHSLMQALSAGGASEETIEATKSGLSALGSEEWGPGLSALVSNDWEQSLGAVAKNSPQGGEQLGALRSIVG